MSHSIQSQSYLVPGVHSEGKKVVTGQGVFMPMTAFWDTFPWPRGYVFGAKNHVLMLHSLFGYRDRTEWLLSSVVNSSGNVVFALLNHAPLQQCKFLQWVTWLKMAVKTVHLRTTRLHIRAFGGNAVHKWTGTALNFMKFYLCLVHSMVISTAQVLYVHTNGQKSTQ